MMECENIRHEINKNMIILSEEIKEKKIDLEHIKFTKSQQRTEYNKQIKEYENLKKQILSEELKLEKIEKQIIKSRCKHNMTMHNINNDFVQNFNDFGSRMNPEITESLIEFFGYEFSPSNTFQKIIKDEDELKNLLEYCEFFNIHNEDKLKKRMPQLNKSLPVNELMSQYRDSIFNGDTTSMINYSNKEKILSIKSKYSNNLPYPFDWLIDYIISIYFTNEKMEEKDVVTIKIEELNKIKNSVFMELKILEAEIFKNDSQYRNITKYCKTINSLFERYKVILEIEIDSERSQKLNEFLAQLNEFKKLNLNGVRKLDNMNSLTLKSEYSEDYSLSNFEDTNLNNLVASIEKQFPKKEKNSKNNDTIESIVNGLGRLKTDDGKSKMKIAKKIKNKKLKISKTNSDIEDDKLNNSQIISKMNILAGNTISDAKQTSKKSSAFFNLKLNKNAILVSPRGSSKNLKKTNSGSKLNCKLIQSDQSKSEVPKSKNNLKTNTSINNNKIQPILTNENLINDSDEKLKGQRQNCKTNDVENRKLTTNTSSGINIEKLKKGGIIFNSSTSRNSQYLIPSQIDQIENVSDEWMISPLNIIPVRTSKLISEKPVRLRSFKPLSNYLNLKIDKPINNSGGCCVSCV